MAAFDQRGAKGGEDSPQNGIRCPVNVDTGVSTKPCGGGWGWGPLGLVPLTFLSNLRRAVLPMVKLTRGRYKSRLVPRPTCCEKYPFFFPSSCPTSSHLEIFSTSTTSHFFTSPDNRTKLSTWQTRNLRPCSWITPRRMNPRLTISSKKMFLHSMLSRQKLFCEKSIGISSLSYHFYICYLSWSKSFPSLGTPQYPIFYLE